MAPTSTSLTTKVAHGSPYQLDKDQTLRAANALVKHIRSEEKRKETESNTRNLLAADDDEIDENDVPVWLVLTTKNHVVDQKRLKPGKITIPHPLMTSPTSTICLITADPQRTFKDAIADPSFSPSLAKRITRVIGVSKLRTKYKSYESRRQLRDEYDIFLADDRIVTMLPKILGKIFYQATAKRPLPINISPVGKPKPERTVKKDKDAPKDAATPQQIAREVEQTLSAALVHLSPSVTTSVRVARSSFNPSQVAENVEAVVNGVIEKFVPQKWRNIKSIHIKGPNTIALPVWLADELWISNEDVTEENPEKSLENMETKEAKALEAAPISEKKKRKGDSTEEKSKKKRKSDAVDLSDEIALRKEKLKKQKAEAMKAVEA